MRREERRGDVFTSFPDLECGISDEGWVHDAAGGAVEVLQRYQKEITGEKIRERYTYIYIYICMSYTCMT